MTVTTSTNQDECKTVLNKLGVKPEDIRPLPPYKVCDSITEIGGRCWLVISFTIDEGFKMHFIEDASNNEAWEFYNEVRGGGPQLNPRLVFPQAAPAALYSETN